MGFFDIFSTSFLFSIAIIILFCGGLFTYFSYKIDTQNHKLTSMVNLVSVLADDLQFVKNKLNKNNVDKYNVDNNLHKIQMIHKVNSELISVSDGEDDEEDEEQDDEDEQDDEEDEDDEQDDEEQPDQPNQYSFKNVSLTDDTLTLTNDALTNDTLTNNFKEIKTIHLENPISFEEPNISLSTNLTNNDISFLKNVNMTDFENCENVEDLQSSYKKMSINKLREVIVSKGVVSDASKLKKNEILKMLELD